MTGFDRARWLALLIPAGLLAGAYGSQYLGGLYPCEMCWWQRWPHFAALPFALGAFLLPGDGLRRILVALAALAVLVSGLIGGFHAGVEYGWWEGLTACSTTPTGGSSTDILSQIMATPITRCDVAPWSLFGISLAGYNGLLSGAAALAILALLLKARKA